MFVDHFDRPPLGVSSVEDQVSSHRDRTYKTHAWGLLQGLWETERWGSATSLLAGW